MEILLFLDSSLLIKTKFMFDQILELVKEHLGNNPDITANFPADQQDALHNEIANHVTNSLTTQPTENSGGIGGMFGGILSKLESGVASGSPVTSALEGGLVSSLASKFGLPPSVTGAIAVALPGLLQKYAAKTQGTTNQ
jgi:hypothetical protein